MTIKPESIVHRFPWATGDDAQVWVVDFSSKSTPLIAQLLRAIGLTSRPLSVEGLAQAWAGEQTRPKLIILSGGNDSVTQLGAPKIPESVFHGIRTSGICVLGICYGAQLLAVLDGGMVKASATPEFGEAHVECTAGSFGAYPGGSVVMNHNDEIEYLPGWQVLASTNRCYHAFARRDNLFAVQFHPEMDHTEHGGELLREIAFNIAGCTSDYAFDPSQFIAEARVWMNDICAPYARAVCAYSGGVDSAVAEAIARPVFEDRMRSIFVDNGFMRAGEAARVRSVQGGEGLVVVDAAERFYEAIDLIPFGLARSLREQRYFEGQYFEDVRRAIGATFFCVFSEEARKLGLQPGMRAALIQGTNAADIVESSTKLKSHHNVGTIEHELGLDVIEPLAGLYKMEIRLLALALGLPESVAFGQPFPGPGLALRFSGRFFREYVQPLQQANAILEEIVAKAWPNLHDPARPCQYYVALGTSPTTGLLGDERVIGYSLIVRMVWSRARESYSTLHVNALSQELQNMLSSRLINEMQGDVPIVRVFYELTGKPPSTTEPH